MHDEPYLDYHEVFPTRWEITAAYAICCAKCHVTKHAKHFRQPLTRAQATARGYKGLPNQDELPRHLKGDRLATIESKYCNKCQPRAYKPDEMSTKQIYEAAYNGRVTLARASLDAAEKRQQKADRMREVANKRWGYLKSAPWLHIRKKVDAELGYITRALSYFETRICKWEEENVDRKNYKSAMRAEASIEARVLSDFFRELRLVLSPVRARCTLNAKTERTVDKDLTWHTLVGEQDMRRLSELWQEIPIAQRGRLHRTPVLVNRMATSEPLFADYISEQEQKQQRFEELRQQLRDKASRRNL